MLYRIDYAMALLVAGLLVGIAFSRLTPRIPEPRIAVTWYYLLAGLSSVRVLAYSFLLVSAQHSVWLQVIGNAIGDLLAVAFAAGIGCTFSHRALVRNRTFLDGMFLVVAFSFASSGIAKALSMSVMEKFFADSGYPLAFLKFIELAEVFGGIGLLLSWARVPALLGLTIDMFGAVLTHVHNGDPVNDNTGAVGMLLRLIALGALLKLSRPEPGSRRRELNHLLTVVLPILVCFLIAYSATRALRRPPSPMHSSVTRRDNCLGRFSKRVEERRKVIESSEQLDASPVPFCLKAPTVRQG